MKGPSEKGNKFAVLEYMKAGQVVTHPCAPLQKIEFFIRSPSPSPEPTSSSQEGFPSRTFVDLSCFIACENMGVNLNFHVSIAFLCLHAFVEVEVHSYYALIYVCVGSCICHAQATPVSKLQ